MNHEDSRMRAKVYDAWETRYAPDLADRLDIAPDDPDKYLRMLELVRDLIDYELIALRHSRR